MLLTSEILQWAVLLFLVFMVFGLTRQLGFFLVPHQEQLKQQGPQEGDRLGGEIFTPADRTAFQRALTATESRGGAVIVIDENCIGCRQLLEDLEQLSRAPRLMPLVGWVRRSSPAFVERAGAVFDVVLDDAEGARASGAGIVGTPFAMMIDADLRVERVELGALLPELLESCFSTVAQDTSETPSGLQVALHKPTMEMTK
jgi:hypothetical protein